MKKKFREITVDGVKYGWAIKMHSSLIIWKDKKQIHSVNTEHIIVTPAFVADTIKSLNL